MAAILSRRDGLILASSSELRRRDYNGKTYQITKFMGPTWPPWVLSAPDGPHVGPMNLAMRDIYHQAGYIYHRYALNTFKCLQYLSIPAWATYINIAKEKPAWILGQTEEQTNVITDGSDDPATVIREHFGAGWAFAAVDLEASVEIGYIRVLMSVCKCIIMYRTSFDIFIQYD